MRYKKRNGFALIYTVLIGALVLISIVGLTMRVVPENAITKARTNSQRALAVAETGVSQVLFDLRNFGTDSNHPNVFDPNSGSLHYLPAPSDPNDIIQLIGCTTANKVFAYGEQQTSSASDNFVTSYQAKIKVNSNDTVNKILDVDLYVLGTVKDRSENVLAREAIKTNFTINYKIDPVYGTKPTTEWVPGTSSGVFDYALYSGGDIVFGGSAQTVQGSIHAVGTIDLGNAQNQVRVGGNGNAEAEKNITGSGIVTGKSYEGQSAPSVPFPTINIDVYKGLADAFRSGQPPYDGSNPNFPNITDLTVQAVIQSYLGTPGSSSSLAGINNFYNALKNGTLPLSPTELSAANLNLATAKNIVYYVKGDIQGNVNINGNFACIGTLVVDGNLKINGHATIGDPSDPGAAAILVKGNIDLSNGTADLYGLFYATGGLTGSGTFSCEGSIATKGTIDVRGNYTIKYHDITNANLGISDPGHYKTTETPVLTGYNYSVTSAAGAGISSTSSDYKWWKVSYDEFDNLKNP
jgi:hypothetical protein